MREPGPWALAAAVATAAECAAATAAGLVHVEDLGPVEDLQVAMAAVVVSEEVQAATMPLPLPPLHPIHLPTMPLLELTVVRSFMFAT